MDTNLKSHLKSLVQLSIRDKDFQEPERGYVYAIGRANKLSEADIDKLVRGVLKRKEEENIEFSGLMSEEKFGYLFDIIQLMKIDGEVFLSEIKYCEGIAEKLGYDKKVVKSLSSRIYRDPTVTGDREAIRKEASKYLK